MARLSPTRWKYMLWCAVPCWPRNSCIMLRTLRIGPITNFLYEFRNSPTIHHLSRLYHSTFPRGCSANPSTFAYHGQRSLLPTSSSLKEPAASFSRESHGSISPSTIYCVYSRTPNHHHFGQSIVESFRSPLRELRSMVCTIISSLNYDS